MVFFFEVGLFFLTESSISIILKGAFATKLWYNQIKNYDFAKPGFRMNAGNFTQVVWKGSTQFGFGVADDSKGNYYVVANYYPAGISIALQTIIITS